jgi:glycosidase
MTVPYWVQDAIFYQIFPDRFANSDPRNDPPNVQPWGSEPNIWDFQGGDLRGIIQNFDYLLDLGINALYLNPIFQSPSNHRYNISDYFRIDPKLGDMNDFKAMLEVAHSNGVRVILDGVFNHCSRGFFAFNDILENRERSPYRDWFHIKRFPVDAFSPGKAKDYLAWWDFKSLPKFNTNHPGVRRFIFNVARYWIEMGADGWRLDVPNEIDDDAFWAEFRHVVKSVNHDAFLLGEIWDGDPRWVGEHHFDGLMNYPVRQELLNLLLEENTTTCDFADKVEALIEQFPRQNVYAMYVPMGSHDTRRLMSKLKNDLNKVLMAFSFQFAYPGAPAIYYGDEIGMEGDKDPDCRRAFPWDRSQWNTELRSFVRGLVTLRKRLAVLRRGDYRSVLIDKRRCCYAFARTLGDDAVLVILNASVSRRYLKLPVEALGWPDGRIVRNLLAHELPRLEDEEFIVSGDELVINLQPWTSVWVG